MTATTVPASEPARIERSAGMLAGLRPLFRKDIADWRSGKGPWIVVIITTLFMALAAANSYISGYLIRTLRPNRPAARRRSRCRSSRSTTSCRRSARKSSSS